MYFSSFNIIFLLTIIHQSIASGWNYGQEGPDVWSDAYPTCAGNAQSPINIRTACTAYKLFSPFKFSDAYDATQNFKFINNGHSISGTYTGDDLSIFTLTGGGLHGTYIFSSFHLHWGENYKSGSEHHVNGQKYSGEVHFIHTNPTTNQTAVLGMFIKSNKETTTTHAKKRKKVISRTQDPTLVEWENYLSEAGALQQINDTVVFDINLASLFSSNLKAFWRYTGSLTTPPCTEGIIWTVFKHPINVNDDQLEQLRNNVYSEDFRETQPIHNRIVYRSFQHEAASSTADYVCCSNKE